MPRFVITALHTQAGDRKNVYYAADVSAVNRALPRLQKKYGGIYADWRVESYHHSE